MEAIELSTFYFLWFIQLHNFQEQEFMNWKDSYTANDAKF